MSKESAEEFLMDSEIVDEVSSVIDSLEVKDNEIGRKIDLIVAEAAKRGYNFTASDLRKIIDECAKFEENENFKNITGGRGKIMLTIKDMFPY